MFKKKYLLLNDKYLYLIEGWIQVLWGLKLNDIWAEPYLREEKLTYKIWYEVVFKLVLSFKLMTFKKILIAEKRFPHFMS